MFISIRDAKMSTEITLPPPFDDVQTSHLCESAGNSHLAELTKFNAFR